MGLKVKPTVFNRRFEEIGYDSQTALAQELGLHSSVIGHYAAGGGVTSTVAVRMANALGLHPNDLFVYRSKSFRGRARRASKTPEEFLMESAARKGSQISAALVHKICEFPRRSSQAKPKQPIQRQPRKTGGSDLAKATQIHQKLSMVPAGAMRDAGDPLPADVVDIIRKSISSAREETLLAMISFYQLAPNENPLIRLYNSLGECQKIVDEDLSALVD